MKGNSKTITELKKPFCILNLISTRIFQFTIFCYIFTFPLKYNAVKMIQVTQKLLLKANLDQRKSGSGCDYTCSYNSRVEGAIPPGRSSDE